MRLVASGSAPGARLQTIAWGAVALGAVACAVQVARFARAFNSVDLPTYDYLPFWERFFVDPPDIIGPLIGLAAVVLMLLLPVAPCYDRCRTTVGWLVATASAANLIATLLYLWLAHQGREGIVFGSLIGITLSYLPGYALSAVLLLLIVNTRRWHRRVAAQPLPTDDALPEDLESRQPNRRWGVDEPGTGRPG